MQTMIILQVSRLSNKLSVHLSLKLTDIWKKFVADM